MDSNCNELLLGVCSRERTKRHEMRHYSHILSLIDPERDLSGITKPIHAKYHGWLLFHDLDDIEVQAPQYWGCVAPTKEDIQKIIGFFQHLQQEEGKGILIHCEAGVSRSTAAAIIGLTAMGIPPNEAFEHITNMNPVGLPNRRMLRMADEILQNQGKLYELAENHRRYIFSYIGQEDPAEMLKKEIEKQSRLKRTIQYILFWTKTRGKTLLEGSQLKTFSRWRIKHAMQNKRKAQAAKAKTQHAIPKKESLQSLQNLHTQTT